MPRSLAGAGGPVLGLLLRHDHVCRARSARASSARQPRADRAADGDRLRRRARHDDGHRLGRHRSLGWIGRRAHDRRRRAGARPGWSPGSPRARGRRRRRQSAGWSMVSLVTGLRVVPFIVTLGTMILVRGAAKGLADERRIEAPQTWLNDLLRARGPDEAGVLPAGVWLVARCWRSVVAGVLRYTRLRPSRLCHRLERAHRAALRRRRVADQGRGLHDRRAVRRRRRRSAVLPAVGWRSDGGRRARARRDRRGDHRRRQPVGRTWHRARHVARRHDDGGDSDRLRAEGLPELGAADRDRARSSCSPSRSIDGDRGRPRHGV